MSYYDDRRYSAPRDRARGGGTAADYFDNHPRGRDARVERDPYPSYRDNGSIEEIPRDFPPGRDYVYERYEGRRPRRPVYENVRRASSVSGDPYYDSGYHRRSRPQKSRRYDDRPPPRRSRYDSVSSSRSPPRHSRRKSIGDAALGALGLGAASKVSSRSDRDRERDRYPGRDRGRSHSRHGRYSSSSRSRSRDRHGGKRNKSEQRMMQAARAALTAGAAEAFRSRKDPGEWSGAKGKRVLTAAVTAAGTDGLVDKDPKKHGTRHVIESTLAGLATSHFINGGSSKSRDRDGRGRSSTGGGLKNLAATGALAAAGKEIYNRVSRSRSKPRGRDDSRDRDSDDDRRGSKKRSKSVSDYINKGIAALGLDEGKDRGSRDRSRSRDRDDRSDRRDRRHHHDRDHRDRDRDRDSRYGGYSDSDSDTEYGRGYSRRGRGSRDVGRTRSLNGGRTPQSPRSGGTNGKKSATTSTARGGSPQLRDSDEKKTQKKMRRDMLLTSGLATVATIHAGHSVYGSVNKRKERMAQLKSGEISAEEARKQRMKANVLDAASIGLAALGLKGAYGEWKEVNEKRKETNNFQHECVRRAMRRELKRNRSNSLPSYHRWPDEIEDAGAHDGYGGHGNGGISYHDGNPYGATMEAPAISY
ncbi:hypothetical protein N7509_012342 [Penicillium cosmopolitanum]|uniref:DUF3824 domain-containing protein n=1 Tax=Penicillium cosmopolitanum TaxID=1131564 RepID=A0A9W9VEJ5_9EURO|nr:uncharacterized protein N7509_012342 [Penicillium cosmopolitanum]KAJ5379223.1 hypothetical protein N7509_012342 [Penicillium cosmopolitanum]